MACSCSCGGDATTKLIYACAGAANTGYLADQVARKLNRDGSGDMTCLAAVGADPFRFHRVGKIRGQERRDRRVPGCLRKEKYLKARGFRSRISSRPILALKRRKP